MSTPVFVPAVGAASARRARATRQLTGALRKAGATSEATSTPLVPGDRIETAQLSRLIRLGAVRQGRNGYWLDEERYREIRHARLRLVAIVLILEVAFVLTLALYLPRHH